MKKEVKIGSHHTPKKEKTDWKKILSMGSVSKKELLLFTNNLAIMLKAGATLIEALHVLQEQSKSKMFYILQDVTNQVERGNKLSDSLRKYDKVFSEIYVNMLEIGEESGKLEENLLYLAKQLEDSYALRKKIVGALIYPSVVAFSGIGIGLGIAIFILPKIAGMFKNFDVALPLSTRFLIAVSDFFQKFGGWAIIGIISFFVFFFWITKRKFVKPLTHWIILHLPIVKSLSYNMNVSMFCHTLSSLLKSGVTIDESFIICKNTTNNFYYKRFLARAWERIKSGDNLTNILKANKKLFPLTDIQIISIGEASGTLTESLNYCATLHDREIDDITKNLSNLMEPILLVAIGLMVGFLAISIITPIYSITSKFRA